jgi:hypothetical protein
MFEWLLLLFTPVPPYAPPKKDYIGVVAAEVACASMLPRKKEVAVWHDDPGCPTCKGTGKVPSGDKNGTTECPDPRHFAPVKGGALPMRTLPAPEMKLQVKPLPPIKTGSCPDGKCPLPRT